MGHKPKGTLNVFDIDDTLFKTDSRVKVVSRDTKSIIKRLASGTFNSHQLGDGEEFDFSEFRDSKLFHDTAVPMEKMLKKAHEIYHSQDEYSRTILLTARADFDDKALFLKKFRDHGFPIDNVYVERAGNLSKLNPKSGTHINKAVVLRKYINSGLYNKIQMWDDHTKNLDILFKLGKIHPEIEFIAYLVDKNGNFSRYHNNLNEEIELPVSSINISRSYMPQINSQLMQLVLTDLTLSGINYQIKKIPAYKLKALQGEFNKEKIAAIIKSKKTKGAIYVSNDFYVIDGNHRWIAQLNLNPMKDMEAIMIDLPALELLKFMRSLEVVEYKSVTENVKNIVKSTIKSRNY